MLFCDKRKSSTVTWNVIARNVSSRKDAGKPFCTCLCKYVCIPFIYPVFHIRLWYFSCIILPVYHSRIWKNRWFELSCNKTLQLEKIEKSGKLCYDIKSLYHKIVTLLINHVTEMSINRRSIHMLKFLQKINMN